MRQYRILRTIKHLLCLLLSLVFVFPLVWIFLTAVKTDIEVRTGFSFLPSNGWHWENFKNAWMATNFARQFVNSLIMAISVTLGQIFTSALAGYAFARLKFKGKPTVFALTLATLIIPYQLLVLPIYIMFSKIGWIDTYSALIVPTLANAFGIFLFKQHFETIPISI
jgi:multiple sugar transport system permease protein